MISRQQALELLKSMPQKESDMNHYLESEAIMKKLAEKFGGDIEYWGMLGLLHNVDWALTRDNWEEHCSKAEQILKEEGFDDKFIQIVQSHAYSYNEIPRFKDKKRSEKIEHCLAASETLTGLIHAYALMRKSIEGMEASGLKKKFKDKTFAANCNREIIREIEPYLPLNEFFELAIKAVQEITEQTGLG